MNKETFLAALACPTYGWLIARLKSAPAPPSLSDQWRMEEGLEVHQRARNCFPGGILIDNSSVASAAAETKAYLADKKVSTIFEGTFTKEDAVAKADILQRQKTRWHLIEVKSSINDKPEHIDDLAHTARVLKQAGLKISQYSLWLISQEYRLGGPRHGSFYGKRRYGCSFGSGKRI